jgi:Fe-S cluster assembly ATP-binding protein
MGPNGAEKYACVNHRRNETYEVTDGEIILEGEDLELAPEERAHKGYSFRFSTQ